MPSSMDFINKLTDGGEPNKEAAQQDASGSGGGLMGQFNSMAGGGQAGEKNEDGLDKGVDFVQERFMGQGQQSNETAAEQAKDEMISDQIRGKFSSTTGTDMPIKDKETRFGM